MIISKAHFNRVYNVCIINCPSGDLICVGMCSRELQDNMLRCPCQSGCPQGCPCEEYVCPTTTPSFTTSTTTSSTTTSLSALTTTTTTTTTTMTTASPKTEVLVLNTYNKANVPIITNASGREDRNFYFLYDENTEAVHSCGLTWRGQYYIFGGSSKKTQISKVIGCQLKLIGELSFDHNHGACASVADNKIFLCFNDESGDYKKCRMCSSPIGKPQELVESVDNHRRISIAASQCKCNYFVPNSTRLVVPKVNFFPLSIFLCKKLFLT